MHRRNILRLGAALSAAVALPRAWAQNKPRINPPTLFENHIGGYRILPSGTVFSGGTIAMEGHEIVHALLKPWVPLKDAWRFIESHLKTLGRPVQALCGMELRIPEQLTFEGFRAFNAPYVEQLQKWELLVGRYSALCRTNVAPSVNPPTEPMVHAFSYCVPTTNKGVTFCVSGAADLDGRGRPVAAGDVSPAGMKLRLQYVVETITERLAEMEFEWSDVTHIDLCVAQDIGALWEEAEMPGLNPAVRRAARVHPARPPIVGAEVELECRGVRQEISLVS